MSIEHTPLLDSPPVAERVTDYDLAHRITYLRLLDAEADGANWEEAAAVIFGFNLDGDYERAKRVHEAHLERARWMTRVGYRDLLHREE
jgi:hypothetical protein